MRERCPPKRRSRATGNLPAYRPDDAEQTIGALRALDPAQPVVAFHLGLAELWSGDCAAAQTTLERVKRIDPYGYYGERADNALHPGMVRGYPLYFPSISYGTATLAQRRAAVRRTPGDPAAWMALAVMLEQQHRAEAISAVRHAIDDAPTDVSPRVAFAVLSFDKDSPGVSFGQLGRLLQQAPDNTEIRFHVGLLAFWLKLYDRAVGEFQQVDRADPNGPYAGLATEFARCVSALQNGHAAC